MIPTTPPPNKANIPVLLELDVDSGFVAVASLDWGILVADSKATGLVIVATWVVEVATDWVDEAASVALAPVGVGRAISASE